MDQTIDLREQEELEIPKPPAEEVVVETITENEYSPADWVAHLTPPTHRERIWYVIGVLIIAAILVGVFLQDIMFTIVLGLSALILILNTFKPHHPSSIGIHATGVSVNDEHHRFSDMKSFWIDYRPPYIKELSLEFKKGLTHRLRIPLENQNPLEVRQMMVSYVPEKEHEPTMLDHLVRLIGI